jgi:hypothetical protein
MSSPQKPETKLKMLTVLAKHSGIWLWQKEIARQARTKSDRIQPTLDSFEKRKFVKSKNWENMDKKEKRELNDGNIPFEISESTKVIYKIDDEGWKKLKNSLQDCFVDENVLDLMNIPEKFKNL